MPNVDPERERQERERAAAKEKARPGLIREAKRAKAEAEKAAAVPPVEEQG
jgi:hypothetical protein